VDSPNLGGLDAWAADSRKVDKPWGYELIWAETDRYVGKVLFVKAGESLSLQFH
jgi:mannose-6-phosphate isomerase